MYTLKGRNNNFAVPVLILIFPLLLISCTYNIQASSLWRENEKSDMSEDSPIKANTFVNIAKKAEPSVVYISTTKDMEMPNNFWWDNSGPFGGQGRNNQGNPFEDLFGNEFFKKFFGQPNPHGKGNKFKQQGLGSGFIINKEGYIVTNWHVVEKSDKIMVTMNNEEEYEAKIIGLDSKTDVALIKIEGKDFPVVPLGDSDKLKVGEIVVAIGNPFGYAHTVTHGIVSAKERTIGFGNYDQFIQTDASINPGNSGGPLLNLRGEVVGINAAIAATGHGIGFAIPINLAKDILRQLKDKGKVTRGMLGVYIQKITPNLMKSLNLKTKQGALVSGIIKDSPADKAGLKQGDVVIRYNGREIQDNNDLPMLVATTPVGEEAELVIIRDGNEKKLKIKITEMKEEETTVASSEVGSKLGVKVQTLTKELAKSLGLDENMRGVVVTDVDENSAAFRSGLRSRDIILEVNKKKVETVEKYLNEVKNIKKGGNVLLLVQHGEQTIFMAFTVE